MQGPLEIEVRCGLENEQFVLTISVHTFLASYGQMNSALLDVNERVRLAFGELAYCDERVILGSSGKAVAMVLSFPAMERENG